jgi:hypothetical protein
MVEHLPPADVVSPLVSDDAVPAEKVETKHASKRKAHRAGRFLKGPTPLSWIRDQIRNPADRLLLVLIAHSDMRQSTELKITADILSDAGITHRKASYRALNTLEASGSLSIQRHRGRRPVVRLLVKPDSRRKDR